MDLLEYIKMQRDNGVDDYMTIQAAKKYMIQKEQYVINDNHAQIGGNEEDVKQLKNQVEYLMQQDQKVNAPPTPPTPSLPSTKPATSVVSRPANVADLSIAPENLRVEKTSFEYETIKNGAVLFHPSQELQGFSDTMIFVNIADQCNQRTFSLFFTPNEQYAKRYSGLWSLNKRPVYIHKLRVRTDISGIKIIKAEDVPNGLENLKLAQNICGATVDGHVNGIKIEQNINGQQSVSEYYICNPDRFFNHISTEMQISSNQWVNISR